LFSILNLELEKKEVAVNNGGNDTGGGEIK
jgi:hypothetical protein